MKFLSNRIRRNQRGFTLVELLVVVGIIVALAAVIIPNVASFAGKGDTGAQAAERENIQAAIDNMMADTGATTVTPTDTAGGSSTNDFSTSSGILDLEAGAYLRTVTTKYFYCWTTTGLVNSLDTSATVDCTDSN